MVSNSDWGLTNTIYPKAVGCVSWSRGCLRDFWFGYALNQHLTNVEMPGGSAAVSEPSFAGASGRLISCVFMIGPGFNFLRLTKSDCLWQSNLSIWHILASAEYEEQVMQQGNWQVLACFSEKRSYIKMCSILQKRIWSPFFMLDQRAYLVFKVSALLPLLHMLVDLSGIQKNELEFFIRWPNLEIFCYYPSFLPCKSEKSHGLKKEYCHPLHRDHYL